MPFDFYGRCEELRAEDPSGRMSNADIERRVTIEQIQYEIEDLPDCGPLYPIRSILKKIVEVL